MYTAEVICCFVSYAAEMRSAFAGHTTEVLSSFAVYAAEVLSSFCCHLTVKAGLNGSLTSSKHFMCVREENRLT